MNTTHPMNPPTHPTAPGYTPGPWIAVPTTAQNRRAGTRRKDIVTTSGEWNPAFVAGDIAPGDAALIALAPEMAEALQDAARCLSEYRSTGSMAGWDKTLSQARAILARVNGGGV